MKRRKRVQQAWGATIAFYLVLLIVVTILDSVNHVLTLPYWGTQIGLISVGVVIFVLVGRKFPDLSAQRGVLLAFGVGILTIIPGVLLSLNPPPDFWTQYFSIGLSLAAGSFLSFMFIKLFRRVSD